LYHAVFVRQQGVILRGRNDAHEDGCPAEFLPGAVEALEQLTGAGLYVLVMISRVRVRSWAGAGHISLQAWSPILQAVDADRGRIEAVCCDKGLAERRGHRPTTDVERIWPIAHERGIDLSTSYFVGNHLSDLEAGRLVGCRERYLVLTGHGRQELARCWLHGEQGFRIVFDLKAAAGDILLRERGPIAQAAPAATREVIVR
jgi:histidinol phosphatase-like enzyme